MAKQRSENNSGAAVETQRKNSRGKLFLEASYFNIPLSTNAEVTVIIIGGEV